MKGIQDHFLNPWSESQLKLYLIQSGYLSTQNKKQYVANKLVIQQKNYFSSMKIKPKTCLKFWGINNESDE